MQDLSTGGFCAGKLPAPMTLSIEVINPVHVRAHYHTLAHLDLRGAGGCYNPNYVRQMVAY